MKAGQEGSHDLLERIAEAQSIVEGEYDNLLEAIVALAAAGQMTVMPRGDRLINKPVILLPQRMYDRAIALFGSDSGPEGGGNV